LRVIVQLATIGALIIVGYFAWQSRASLPLVGGYFAETDNKARRRGGRPVPVDLAKAKYDRIASNISVVGTLKSNQAVTLTSEVTARVRQIYIKDGQQVRGNTVLVQLDDQQIRAEYAEAEANLTRAQQVYSRNEKLRKARAITNSRLEELQLELSVAKASSDQIRARLERYQIRAPFSGQLGLKQVAKGTLLQPGTAIVTLDDISSVKLDFDVPETALAALKPGLDVVATSAAYPGRVFVATVATIDSRIDPTTRAVTVRALIPNDDRALRPGMFLNVDLEIGVIEQALIVPEAAILASDDGTYLFAVKDGAVERRQVELGRRKPGFVQVLRGLKPGEPVVVGGVQKVRQGAKIIDRAAPKPEKPADAGKGPQS